MLSRNSRVGMFSCGLVLACCFAAEVLAACKQQCKQIEGLSSTVGSCRAFSPATCNTGLTWVNGGSTGSCVAVSPQVNITWYSCAQGCTDQCPGSGGPREYAPPANYDNGTVCTVNGTIPQYDCVGTM